MALHSQYRRDKSTTWLAVAAGVEVECAHFDPKSPEYIAHMTKLTKPVRKLVEQGLLKPAADRKYAVQCFCDVVVKGWRTVDEEGNVTRPGEIEVKEGEWVKYSTEAAVQVFTDYPPFYSDVVDMARELGNFQLTEDEVKNFASA